MKEDIRAKLEALLKNADSSQIEKLMKLKNSNLASGLSEEQKQAILSAFLKADTETIQNKLKNLDLSKLDLNSLKDKLR